MTNKEKFIEILQKTGRDNIQTVIDNLEQLGFFNAPASTRFHLNIPGGLLQHSLAVFSAAITLKQSMTTLNPELEAALPDQSIAIAALLHDVCKAEIYKTAFRNQKIDGVWQQVQVYEPDYSHCPLGHGEKSVIRLLQWGLRLTEAETCAIRWHMGAWGLNLNGTEEKANIAAAQEKHPLVTLIQIADMASTYLFEKR